MHAPTCTISRRSILLKFARKSLISALWSASWQMPCGAARRVSCPDVRSSTLCQVKPDAHEAIEVSLRASCRSSPPQRRPLPRSRDKRAVAAAPARQTRPQLAKLSTHAVCCNTPPNWSRIIPNPTVPSNPPPKPTQE